MAELFKSSSSLGVVRLRVRARSISLRTLLKYVQPVVLQDTDAGGKTEGRSDRTDGGCVGGRHKCGGERIPPVSEEDQGPREWEWKRGRKGKQKLERTRGKQKKMQNARGRGRDERK